MEPALRFLELKCMYQGGRTGFPNRRNLNALSRRRNELRKLALLAHRTRGIGRKL